MEKQAIESYRTMYNGSVPYRVIVDSIHNEIKVEYLKYNYDDGDFCDFQKDPMTVTPIISSKFLQIWIADGVDNFTKKIDPDFIGNSIVAQTTEKTCIFIGSNVVCFEAVPGDSFESAVFVSNVGNSAVPYPWLIGNTHVYFLLDFRALPKIYFDLSKDLYSQYYSRVRDQKHHYGCNNHSFEYEDEILFGLNIKQQEYHRP